MDEEIDTFQSALAGEVSMGIYKVEGDHLRFSSTQDSQWLHQFYTNILKRYIDSYLVAAQALQSLR